MAGPDGSFQIAGVRPGEYVLRAFADGVPGEFQRAEIHVQSANPTNVGAIDWIPARSSLVLRLNGEQIGATGSLPENGVMHRDSHRGLWFERSFEIPAERIRSGETVLEFRLHGNVWHQGLLYDYIRLETLQPHEDN